MRGGVRAERPKLRRGADCHCRRRKKSEFATAVWLVWVQSAPSSLATATAVFASIADAGEALARPTTVGHITLATGAPERLDAATDGGGACTGPILLQKSARQSNAPDFVGRVGGLSSEW